MTNSSTRRISASILLSAALLANGVACKKKGSSERPAPAKALLVSPVANSTCISGNSISASQTRITLSWNAASNANAYEVKLKNLLNQSVSTHLSAGNQIEVNLLRNTPYAWSVVSKSDAHPATAESDTWKFYVAGEATVSYAPFPADLISPVHAQTVGAAGGKVTLSWSAADVDNDIANYEVYFGTSAENMVRIKNNLTGNPDTEIAVSSGTTYYWRILTKDSKGNVSWSDIRWFKAGS